MTVTPLPGLPGLFHIGWVVRDCAAAQRELSARLGAGPFVSAGTEARFDQPQALAVFGAALDLVAGARPFQQEREKR